MRYLRNTGHQTAPCPFCGEHAAIDLMKTPLGTHVHCKTCSTLGPNGADLASAIVQWNLRNEEEKLVEAQEPPEKPKNRNCLRCDKLFPTTKHVRICWRCKAAPVFRSGVEEAVKRGRPDVRREE